MVTRPFSATLTKLTLLLTALLLTATVNAQSPGQKQVSATLSSNSIGLDQTAILTVSVEGVGGQVDVRTPTATPEGLTFEQGGRQYSMTSINGVTQASTNITFFITPRVKGRFVINEIPVQVNGQTLSTSTLRLEVTDAVGPTQSANQPQNPWGIPNQFPFNPPSQQQESEREEPIIVESSLEPKTVYEHQAAYYTLRLLKSATLSGDPPFRALVPTGIITVPFPVKNDTDYRNNTRYDSSEQTNALYPLSAGDYTIDPWEVPVTFGGMFGRTKVYRTEPQTLKVLPLPTEGQPTSFTGAVGEDFEITAEVDRPSIRAGQTLDLDVHVKGDGNLDLVPYPHLPEWAGVERHQAAGTSSTQFVGSKLESKKTYKYRLKIKEPGTYQLKDIGLAYFRPSEKRYEVLKVPAITVTVTPGEAGKDEANDPEYLTAKERPAEKPGATVRCQIRVPDIALGLSLGLSLLGLLLAAFARPMKGPKMGTPWGRSKVPRPKDLDSLEQALAAWAGAADSLGRADQLQSAGWSSDQISRFERLKSRVAAARYGVGGGPAENQLADLLSEYDSLKKEVKR